LRPPKWHFAGTRPARHDHRTISQMMQKDSLLILMQKRFIFERGAGRRLRFRWSAGYRHVTGTRSKSSAGLRAPKWHFAGTRPARHDPRTISRWVQKRFTFGNVAPAIWRWRRRSGVGAGIGVGAVGLNSARNGGQVRPERSFVNCMDAADLRIAAPGRLGPPRLRNALAVQARNPKRPRRAPPPILDETALGRPGRSGALYTACNGFNFALQTPIYTRCAPAATPRLSPAGPPALVAQTPRFATKTPT
jgi:hypothetical protein